MSEYGSAGPQGSYGPPGTSGPATPRDPAQLVMITNYAAAGLGVLGFIWGFLNWFSQNGGGPGVPGYEGFGDAAIGLTIAAGLVALAAVVEKRETTLIAAGLAAAALLVTIGQLIKHGEGFGAGIGLILTLITTILQTGALAYGWLLASGRMAAPSSSPKPAQSQQWGGPQGGYGAAPSYPGQQQGGSYPGAGQYQPPQPQGQYGPPPSQPSSTPPPPPQGGQSNNPYGPPQGGPGGAYAPPQGGPARSGSTSSMPVQGNPYGPPATPNPAEPERSGGDSEGYGEATRHIPRYTGPGASNPNEPSGS